MNHYSESAWPGYLKTIRYRAAKAAKSPTEHATNRWCEGMVTAALALIDARNDGRLGVVDDE
jgi:hypothetical protein